MNQVATTKPYLYENPSVWRWLWAAVVLAISLTVASLYCVLALCVGALFLLPVLCIQAVDLLVHQGTMQWNVQNPVLSVSRPFNATLWYIVGWCGCKLHIHDQLGALLDPERPTIGIGQHPTLFGLLATGAAVVRNLPGMWGWVVKWQIILIPPLCVIGVPLLLIGGAVPLVRESRLLSRLALHLVRFNRGTTFIYPDGTRPGQKKAEKSWKWLRRGVHEGWITMSYLHSWVLPIHYPRAGGVRQLVQQNPHAQRVLVVTSFSRLETGFTPWDLLVSLAHGDQFTVWLIGLPERRLNAAMSEEQFRDDLNEIWYREVIPRLHRVSCPMAGNLGDLFDLKAGASAAK